MSRRTLALALAATSTLALTALGSTATADDRGDGDEVRLAARLLPLNSSGVAGGAWVRVDGTTIGKAVVVAKGLTPDGPHLMHIHYGEQARHECPTIFDDAEPRNNLVSVGEGAPAYGPVAVALTESGDAGPASAGAVDRMPVATDGRLTYLRFGIPFSDVPGAAAAGATATAAQVAEAVSAGEGVVVIHGIDYDRDGTLTPTPTATGGMEVSDPATCGVLEVLDDDDHDDDDHEHDHDDGR